MESSEIPYFTIKPEYIRRAREMIINPKLPIAHLWVEGDVEGKSSRDLGFMNGHIEDMLRVASSQATNAPVPDWLKADYQVSLSLYSPEEAIKDIARELPGRDMVAKSRGLKESAPAIRYISDQQEIRNKVAFICSKKGKSRYLKALRPETKYTIAPVPWNDSEIAIIVKV